MCGVVRQSTNFEHVLVGSPDFSPNIEARKLLTNSDNPPKSKLSVLLASTQPIQLGAIGNMGTVIQVANSDELIRALENATGGEQIVLAAGNYGSLALYETSDHSFKYSSEVTITSADVNNLSVFDSVNLIGVHNLTFDSIEFDYNFSTGDVEYLKNVIVRDSENVKIVNSVFDGDLAESGNSQTDGMGTGYGLYVTDSQNITVSNNEFYEWMRAGVYSEVDGLVVSGNDVHDIRSDGFDFVAVNQVLIEGNNFHDFVAAVNSNDHRDMIQFWTAGTTSPSTDIIIRQNIFNSGSGAPTQSIFMRNEMVDTGQAGFEMFYRNILIEDNIIHNSDSHGITVGEVDQLIIQNNTLLQNMDTSGSGAVYVPRINLKEDALNVSVINNITPTEFLKAVNSWYSNNNVVVQSIDVNSANYIGNVFVNALAGGALTLADLTALPDGFIESLGVGSVLSAFNDKPPVPMGYVANTSGTNLNLLVQDFDASNVYGPDGKIDLAGAEVVWDFGDGILGQGISLAHSYANAGSYDVEAVVTLADGRILDLNKTVVVQTPVALEVDFDRGPDDLSDLVNAVTVGSAVTFEQGANGDAVRLNNGLVTYAKSEEMRGNSEFTVLFELKKDAGNLSAAGTVVYFSGSIFMSVQADGLDVTLVTDQGISTLKSADLGINDANWHKVAFTFSGKEGVAKLFVDGAEVGRIDGLAGAVQVGSAHHDFHVGNPFGESFSGLIDNVGFLRGAIAAKDANAGLAELTANVGQGAEGESPTTDSTTDATTDPTTDPTTDSTTDPTTNTDGSPNKGSGRAKFDDHDPIKGTKKKDKLDGTNDSDLLLGYDGTDTIDGKAGDDGLIGGDGGDSLLGGSGSDLLDGEGGSDDLRGQIGDDIIYGGNQADLLYGGAGNDFLYGQRGKDELWGRQGDDYLSGGKGFDLLKGSGGKDVLIGGNGNDELYGGSGADEFVYGNDLNSRDKIFDFTAGEDTITLRGLTGVTIGSILDTAVQVGGDTVLSFDASGENEVTLIGVSKDELKEADFSLAN